MTRATLTVLLKGRLFQLKIMYLFLSSPKQLWNNPRMSYTPAWDRKEYCRAYQI